MIFRARDVVKYNGTDYHLFFFQSVEGEQSGFITGDPGFPIKRENGKSSFISCTSEKKQLSSA